MEGEATYMARIDDQQKTVDSEVTIIGATATTHVHAIVNENANSVKVTTSLIDDLKSKLLGNIIR